MDTYDLRMRLVAELSAIKAPVVFKGATVLRAILSGSNLSVRKGTKDLDIDWYGEQPTMELFESTLNSVLPSVGAGLRAEPFRWLAEYRAAGFKVVNTDGDTVFRIDVNSCDATELVCAYMVDGAEFVGSSLARILADKLATTSQRVVLRRCKDVYDLYLLSHLSGFSIREIREIHNALGVVMGDFEVFLTRIDELHHAYDKLRGIDDKPDFDIVYNATMRFIRPFIDGVSKELFWNGQDWTESSLLLRQ